MTKIEQAFNNLPDVLSDLIINWNTFDEELCEHYQKEIKWLISVSKDTLDVLSYKTIANRVLLINEECKKIIGIDLEEFL